MKTMISFRLRKELDADLIRLQIDEQELPNLCRTGLRLALGIRTAKTLEVRERPLSIPGQQPIGNTAVISEESQTNRRSAAPAALFTPSKGGN